VSSGTKGAHSGSVPAQAKKDPADYDAIIEKYASQFGMDPDLIRYMIATESAFNERAVSPKGAQGLMQLMPETASRLGVRDPFDPDENIWGGTKYMRFLYDTFSSSPDALKLSLAAYNAGENVVLQLGRVPPIRETKDYVQSIINRYGQTTMKVSDLVPERQLFKFIDQNGVLNLTNLPPVLPSASVRTHEGPRPIFR
jgi:soluble lytic murein transglycosylase-like protein